IGSKPDMAQLVGVARHVDRDDAVIPVRERHRHDRAGASGPSMRKRPGASARAPCLTEVRGRYGLRWLELIAASTPAAGSRFPEPFAAAWPRRRASTRTWSARFRARPARALRRHS